MQGCCYRIFFIEWFYNISDMRNPEDEIVAKARDRMRELVQANNDMVDIPVTYEDEQGLVHNYVVSFKKESGGEAWKAFDIVDVGVGGL